ncbi:MAG: hypothetical protein GF364_19545 [Candidatus Lokiarchaeota archaeon]|nr:hypothetical protein [Candidatus Lokiarchaeota archaeon]
MIIKDYLSDDNMTAIKIHCQEMLNHLATADDLESEIIIDDLIELYNRIDERGKQQIKDLFLFKLEKEKSNLLVNNLLLCIKKINKSSQNMRISLKDIIKISPNGRIIDNLIELYSNESEFTDTFIEECFFSRIPALQNFALKLIKYVRSKELNIKIFREIAKIIHEIIDILLNSVNIFSDKEITCEYKSSAYHLDIYKTSCINKISASCSEVVKFNKKLDDLINGKYIKKNDAKELKIALIESLIKKLNIIINSYIDTVNGELLENIRVLIKRFRINKFIDNEFSDMNYYFLDDVNKEEYFKYWISHVVNNKHKQENEDDRKPNSVIHLLKLILYRYIGVFGEKEDINILIKRFKLEENRRVLIEVINSLGKIGERSLDITSRHRILKILEDIGNNERFFYYTTKNMLKIDKEQTTKFIIGQIYSKKPRKIVLASLFIPDLNDERFDKIIINWLKYKQPLIVRQALWVIKKKKQYNAIPYIIEHLFSDNSKIKNDAIDTCLNLKENTLIYLKKHVNYYSPERKLILNNIMQRIQNKIQKKLF